MCSYSYKCIYTSESVLYRILETMELVIIRAHFYLRSQSRGASAPGKGLQKPDQDKSAKKRKWWWSIGKN